MSLTSLPVHMTERLKGKLLERIGLSRRDLEIKMFNDLEEDCRGMDREARYKHIAKGSY